MLAMLGGFVALWAIYFFSVVALLLDIKIGTSAFTLQVPYIYVLFDFSKAVEKRPDPLCHCCFTDEGQRASGSSPGIKIF